MQLYDYSVNSIKRSFITFYTQEASTAMTTKSDKIEQYVAYYRVSTKGQGDSGLGLEAQKATVYGRFGQANIAQEFTEVESGRKAKRVELEKAIAYAKERSLSLVIAKLDRLSRSISFIFALKESGVNFVVCDMPDLNTLNLGLFATIAQHEAETISARTKAALAAKKAQGYKLGKPENLTDAARAKSAESRRRMAQEHEANRKAYLVIHDLEETMSLRGIADKLNAYGDKTVHGKEFTAQQVKNIMGLYEATNARAL